MSTRQYPTIEKIRQCFRYENGKLFWNPRPIEDFPTKKSWLCSNRFANKEAGCLLCAPNGDRRFLIGFTTQGKNFRLYRSTIVWALINGEWTNPIDHINRDATDDRIENLRKCNRSQNNYNKGMHKRNTSGFKGVSWDKQKGYWMARISRNKKIIHLGYFDSKENAANAYHEAAIKYHGEFIGILEG